MVTPTGSALSVISPMSGSLEQKALSAKQALATSTNPSEALKLAKNLIGSYAHVKPDQPEMFLASIAAVLAQYPLAVAQECVDPRAGVARKSEFLSVAKVVEWCDEKLQYLQVISQYQRSPLRRPEQVSELSDEDKAAAHKFLSDLALELKLRSMSDRKPMAAAANVPTDDELRAAYPKRDGAAA